MPIGTLNEEDRQRLSDHFWPIVLKACVANNCWPGEVLNRRRKSHGVKGIAPARAEIVREMQRTVFTYCLLAGECKLFLWEDTGSAVLMPPNARRISFPLLARMLGCDHSTLVLAQQKLKGQAGVRSLQ